VVIKLDRELRLNGLSLIPPPHAAIRALSGAFVGERDLPRLLGECFGKFVIAIHLLFLGASGEISPAARAGRRLPFLVRMGGSVRGPAGAKGNLEFWRVSPPRSKVADLPLDFAGGGGFVIFLARPSSYQAAPGLRRFPQFA
jgi:hypothetical protein